MADARPGSAAGRALEAAGAAGLACVAVLACVVCLAAALLSALLLALLRTAARHGRAALARALPSHPAARALLVLVASANVQGLVLTLLFDTALLRGGRELLLLPLAPALVLARLAAAPGEPAGPYYAIHFVLDTLYLAVLALAMLPRPSGTASRHTRHATRYPLPSSGPSTHPHRGV